MNSLRPAIKDWGLAVGVAGMLLSAGLASAPHPTGADIPGYALLAASGLVLAARRRAPVGVLVGTTGCVLGHQLAGFPVPPVAFLVAVYAATRAGHRTATVVATMVLLAGQPLVSLIGRNGPPMGEALAQGFLGLGWVVAAGVAGEALRQAERRAAEAERTREEIARRRAGEERLHIARELHDSLTHQISIIAVQAGVAVHLARKRGEEVAEALLAIQEAGREATRELRATLAALRDDEHAPTYGLDRVTELVERACAAGTTAILAVDGQRPALPVAVDRAAYRIVQESLTNVARHAGPATATVRISYRPDLLTVRVDDDGRATPGKAPVPGVGLLGMRERVTALGGRLDAGPRDGGGFTVQANLPLVPAP